MKMKVEPTKALTRFIYYFLRTSKAREYFMGRAHGASSTMKKISKQIVQDIAVPIPSLDEQALLVEKLDYFNEATGRLAELAEAKFDTLADLKQAFLQRALSGELTSSPSQAIKEAAE